MQTFENTQSAIASELQNEHKKLILETLSMANTSENTNRSIKQLENLSLKLEEISNKINFNNEFGKLLESDGILSENKIASENLEKNYIELKNFVNITQELLEKTNEFTKISKKISETPLRLLNLPDLKISVMSFQKYILKNSAKFIETKTFAEFSEKVKILAEKIDQCDFLIEFTQISREYQEKIAQILKLPDSNFTIFDLDLIKTREFYDFEIQSRIAEYYAKIRYKNELLKIKNETENLQINIGFSKEFNSKIMQNYEAIFEIFEENLTKLEKIEVIKEISELEKIDCENLKRIIIHIRENLEILILMQDRQIQIKKLFECHAIKEYMGNLYQEFYTSEKLLTILLENFEKNKNLEKFLLDSYNISQIQMISNSIQKLLKDTDDLLESKKLQCPRLLFMSNTQLAEFLQELENSQFRNISMIFPGIKSIIFQDTNNNEIIPLNNYLNNNGKYTGILKLLKEEKDNLIRQGNNKKIEQNVIIGFLGFDNEFVKIVENISYIASKNIEENISWVQKLENQMQKTISTSISNAIGTFTKSALEDWILDFPLQVTLTSIHMIITHEISELLEPELENDDPDQSIEPEEKITKHRTAQPESNKTGSNSKITHDPKTLKELQNMFGENINDEKFPKNLDYENIVKITKENSLQGLRLRLMLWLTLLMKSANKPTLKPPTYEQTRYKIKIIEISITLLNYMKDIIDDLENENVTKQGDYNWKKHIRISWCPEDIACRVDIGSFSLFQKNEYIGNSQRQFLLYPISEKVFINITSSLREKSGVIIKTYAKQDTGSEIFEEFSALCATPMHIFKCTEKTLLKHALQFVNAAALAGIWLLFENISNLDCMTLSTLSKEIQMVQQQFIIAELVPENNEDSNHENSKELSNQDEALLIEHSKDSKQIKRKKQDSPEIKESPSTSQNSKKTTFGIFATVQIEALEKLKEGEKILDVLKGAFRITTALVGEYEIYMENMLSAKWFRNARECARKIFEFYEKVRKSEEKVGFRQLKTIVEIAEKIREKLLKVKKFEENKDIDLNIKRICELKSYEDLFDIEKVEENLLKPVNTDQLEFTSICYALFSYEISHFNTDNIKMSLSEYEKLILLNLSDCKLFIKDYDSMLNFLENLDLTSKKSISKSQLILCIKETIEGLKLIPTENLINKILELYYATFTNKHIVITGHNGSGKSTIISIFCSLMYRLQGNIIKKYVICPQCENNEFLIGNWKQENCILKSIENDIKEQYNILPCIICDSDINNYWLDILLTNSNKIKLIESEIEFPKNTIFIYETTEISKITPRQSTLLKILQIDDSNEIFSNKDILAVGVSNIYEENIEILKNVGIDKQQFAYQIFNIFDDFIQDFHSEKYFFTIIIIITLYKRYEIITSTKNWIKLMKNFMGILRNITKNQNNSSAMKKYIDLNIIISIIWSFGQNILLQNSTDFSIPDQENKFLSSLKKIIEKIQIRYDFDILNFAELFDIWIDYEKIRFVKTMHKLYNENILENLILQSENISIIGNPEQGKSHYLHQILTKNEAKISSGYMNFSSMLLDPIKIRKYVDGFYSVKKKNVATPLSWKNVVFMVSDMHMAYPGNLKNVEFLRFWNDWKGFYDLESYKFKSVANFSIIYTADVSVIKNSQHLQRILDNTIKFIIPNPNKDTQNIFIKQILDPIKSLNSFDKIINLFSELISEFKISNKTLFNICTEFTQNLLTKYNLKIDEKSLSELLFSQFIYGIYDRFTNFDLKIEIYDKINIKIKQNFPIFNIKPNFLFIHNLLPNCTEFSENSFLPISRIREIILNLQNTEKIPIPLYFDENIILLTKIMHIFASGIHNSIFIFPDSNSLCFSQLLEFSNKFFGNTIIQSNFYDFIQCLKNAISDCVKNNKNTVFYLNLNKKSYENSICIDLINLFMNAKYEEIILFSQEFKKSLGENYAKILQSKFKIIFCLDSVEIYHKINMNFPKIITNSYIFYINPLKICDSAQFLVQKIIHTIPEDSLTKFSSEIYNLIQQNLPSKYASFINSPLKFYKFIEQIPFFNHEIRKYAQNRLQTLTTLRNSCDIFTKRIEILRGQQISAQKTLENAENEITKKKKEIDENNKKFAFIVF